MAGPIVYQDNDINSMAWMAYGETTSLMLIVGAPFSGKTTFLLNIAVRLQDINTSLGNKDTCAPFRATEFSKLLNNEETDEFKKFWEARYIFVDDLDHLYEDNEKRELCEIFLTKWMNDHENPKKFVCGFGELSESYLERTGFDSRALSAAYNWLLFPTLQDTTSNESLVEKTKAFLTQSVENSIYSLQENIPTVLNAVITTGANLAVKVSGGHPLLLVMACNRILSSAILPLAREIITHQKKRISTGEAGQETVGRESMLSLESPLEGTTTQGMLLDGNRAFNRIIAWVHGRLSPQCWNELATLADAFDGNKYLWRDNAILTMSGLFKMTPFDAELTLRSYHILCFVVKEYLKCYVNDQTVVNLDSRHQKPLGTEQMPTIANNSISLEPMAGGRIGVLRCGQTAIQLSSVEWQIISVMSAQAGKILLIPEIANLLVNTSDTSSAMVNLGAVRAAIGRLQEKLKTNGLGHLLINIPRKGYVFEVVVKHPLTN